jgi:hypothetical protein
MGHDLIDNLWVVSLVRSQQLASEPDRQSQPMQTRGLGCTRECGRPVRNGVGSMTRELGCTREPVHQASKAESRRHQCMTGETVGIIPHWLWGEGWTNLKDGGVFDLLGWRFGCSKDYSQLGQQLLVRDAISPATCGLSLR